MNYPLQLKSFWNWRKFNVLASREADLYFAILECANSCYWKSNISLPNSTLESMCQITRNELHKRRNTLIQNKLIRYGKGSKGKAGIYNISILYDTNSDTNIDTHNGTNSDTNTAHLYNNKQNINIKKDIPPIPPKEEWEISEPKTEIKQEVILTEEKQPSLNDTRFDEFWKTYPNRKAKGYARRIWDRMKITEPLFDKIMKALEAQLKSPQWLKNQGQFIPHPSTWLNGECWEDDTENNNTPKPGDKDWLPG